MPAELPDSLAGKSREFYVAARVSFPDGEGPRIRHGSGTLVGGLDLVASLTLVNPTAISMKAPKGQWSAPTQSSQSLTQCIRL